MASKKRYVIDLSRDLTRPPHRGVMQIYMLELLTVCHHADMFCDYGHCNSGDIKFLKFYVMSRDHMFKGLCEFMGGSLSQ